LSKRRISGSNHTGLTATLRTIDRQHHVHWAARLFLPAFVLHRGAAISVQEFSPFCFFLGFYFDFDCTLFAWFSVLHCSLVTRRQAVVANPAAPCKPLPPSISSSIVPALLPPFFRSGVDSGRRKGGQRHSPLGTHNLHMGFPIGSKVQKRFLTQNEQNVLGKKEGQKQLKQNRLQSNGAAMSSRAAHKEGGHEEWPRNEEFPIETRNRKNL